jgi:hypothetical protein
MNHLYKKIVSKTGFWLFITLIALVGIYFMLGKEGMQDETNYYTNSEGIKITNIPEKRCVNTSNGERICDEDSKPKPDELNTNAKDRSFIPPKTKSELEDTKVTDSSEPVPANCPSLILIEGPIYVDPSAIPPKYRNNNTTTNI